MTTESLEDGSVRCSMMIDGISASTTVSSMHLAPDKERQLRDAINRAAREAFRKDFKDMFA
tara:strand:+ start:588 stop:770 length:183 start_codon:yes stop_codon:yes gene_type:complete